ncbi:MAG: sulfurtransferase [Propioniciclava sp.]|uniref:sulfurtransferase n=1 Tax=Propioniciclava sp. TaxID=2038686 RepID=UPI0039E60E2F
MIAPVVSVSWLADHPEAVIADVRWYLDGRSGLAAHTSGHIPGSVFVDLDAVLAAPATPQAGRHPLPDPDVFAAGMRAAGISDDSVVVAYDGAGGMSAGRLVWMLRVLGVEAALLDGGLAAWDGDLVTGEGSPVAAGTFTARDWPLDRLATMDEAAGAADAVVIDARAPERYRGDTEPIDPRAGHIPGAVNVPFGGNLDAARHFLAPEALRARFEAVGVTPDRDAIVYCGSGVTACHNLLAIEYAGLGQARLYPGSWSAYSATDRPAAVGG